MSDLAKKTAAKKTAKKVAKKPAPAKAAPKSEKPAPKPAAEKTVKKPAAAKPAAAKSAAKGTEAPASAPKKAASKAERPAAKPSVKAVAGKADTKKPEAQSETKAKSKPARAEAKPDAKKPVAKSDAKAAPKPEKSAEKPTKGKSAPPASPTTQASSKDGAAKPPATKAAASKEAKPKPKTRDETPRGDEADTQDDKKSPRKGMTVVEPAKKPAPKAKPASKYNPPVRPMLLGPGSKLGKPLIPSGPSAPKVTSILDAPKSKRTKSPLTKAKLEKYRALLLAKRAELFGDVQSMENEALRSESGGLSNTPQHLGEQGSESYDQSLSLNLAAQDRRVIKEIDEALRRIEDGTYGLCELTNLPIPEERLDEIPWARHTIEAARQLEQRGPIVGIGGTGNPGGYGQ